MDAEQRDKPYTIDIHRVLELLPHRYPFVMVDRIVDVRRAESATGVKNVTINEPFFQGHFPNAPIMPGVLIIEAMAQTAGALVVETLGPEMEGKLVYFMTIDSARFRQPVVPGDQLKVHVKKLRSRGLVWKFQGEAKVDGKIVAQAAFSAMIMDD